MDLLFAESYDENHNLGAKSNGNKKKKFAAMIDKIPISQDAANNSRLTCQSYMACWENSAFSTFII